jgi:thymidylate synthase (FAD)
MVVSADIPQGFSVSETLRKTSPGGEKWLGKPINCLDDGHIILMDYMGSDESIVQAARVSYGAGTKKVSEDRGLIKYLLRHHHTTPFEMCEVKFRVRVPMDAWRQWIRHRTANVNEYSTRYSLAIDSAQKTDPKQWRSQAKDNKQGSGDYLSEELGSKLSEAEAQLQHAARDIYEERVNAGVAREQARKDLPLSTYTEAYWKVDLHNLFNFLRLRMDSHAQYEIRVYANAIAEVIKDLFPIAYEAFENYILESVQFSGSDKKIMGMIKFFPVDEKKLESAVRDFFKNPPEKGLTREAEETIKKFQALGLVQ